MWSVYEVPERQQHRVILRRYVLYDYAGAGLFDKVRNVIYRSVNQVDERHLFRKSRRAEAHRRFDRRCQKRRRRPVSERVGAAGLPESMKRERVTLPFEDVIYSDVNTEAE